MTLKLLNRRCFKSLNDLKQVMKKICFFFRLESKFTQFKEISLLFYLKFEKCF